MKMLWHASIRVSFKGFSVSKATTGAIPPRRAKNRENGYSIVEVVITTLIIFVIAAIAVIQLQPAWQQIQANGALAQVKSAMRQARETAISERRTIIVQFLTAAANTSCLPTGNVKNCIALTQMVVSPQTPPKPATQTAASSPFLVLPIEPNVQLISFTGEPDTPDGFIGASPTPPNGLYAGSTANPSTMEFQSDGTFTNGTNTINVTILLGEANIPTTARAVTIMGNTGTVTGYQGPGKGWLQ